MTNEQKTRLAIALIKAAAAIIPAVIYFLSR